MRESGRPNGPEISIIIPAWRDEENLAALLPKLRAINGVSEIIVVDASRNHSLDQLARECGAKVLVSTKPSRGKQMNDGAAGAKGEVLVFLHADTEFSQQHLQAIALEMKAPAMVGGAFHRKFDERHPKLMWLEPVARWLTRRGGTLFGDQTVFVRRSIFERLGGFADVPLMEDVEFSPRLRASGKVLILDPPVRSSARHHVGKGAWRRSIQNGLFLLLYKLGVSPQTLHRWYYA